MNPNQNPNFLDSATNYWSSKFKLLQKPIPSQETQNPNPVSCTPCIPTNNVSYYVPNMYSKPQISPPVLNQISNISNTQPNYMVQPSNNFPQMGVMQNMISPQLYANQANIMPNALDLQKNVYVTNQNFYSFPTQNMQNDNLFGSVLNKANNFWHRNLPYSQVQNSNRAPVFYSPQAQGFYSDPISRDISSSNKESEFYSWEGNNSLNKPAPEENFGQTFKPQPLQKKIKKKYKRNNKSNSKKNQSKKTGDSVSIAKKLLAIANNWQEVCKKIPENLQTSFKDKMKRYLKRKILPDLQLKNKLQPFVQFKDPNLEMAVVTEKNESNNNNLNENDEKVDSELKFDEIFGKDFEKLLEKNDGISTSRKENSLGLSWHPPKGYRQEFELESPTLSKILKPDALSINYDMKEIEIPNHNAITHNYEINQNNLEEKQLFFEGSDDNPLRNENEEEVNLIDLMINEKKDQNNEYKE